MVSYDISFCSCLFSQSILCCNIHFYVAVCASSPVLLTAAETSVVCTQHILMRLPGINCSCPGPPHSALGHQRSLHLILVFLLFFCNLLFSPFHLTPTQLYQCHAPTLPTDFQHLDYRLQLNIDSILMYLFI